MANSELPKRVDRGVGTYAEASILPISRRGGRLCPPAGCTGFYIYGAGENHGARLVTLRESDPTAYETRMLYYKDLIGTKLPFGFAGTWGTYVQSIVLLAVCALVLVLTGAVFLTVYLVKKHRRRNAAKQ